MSSPADARRPLLEVERLSVAFRSRAGTDTVVHDLSLRVEPGEIVALVGESGSGKSVTARSLVGLAGDSARVTADTLRIGGVEHRDASERRWRAARGRRVGFVLQDALVSLDPLRTIGAEIAEPLLTHRVVPRAGAAARVQELLVRAGVPEPELRAGQRSGELSGGLRQRALIASAIAAEPSLLIADEPTTALDVTVQQQILRLLAGLADDGRGVLLITHDLAVVSQVAHRVLVLRHGRVVEEGAVRDVLERPEHPYTRGLLAVVPSAATRGQRLVLEGEEAAARDGQGEERSPQAGQAATPAVEPSPEPILALDRVGVDFRGPGGSVRSAVSEVSLSIRAGETLGVVGESGSGKTTLGRIALALQRPARGSATLDGEAWSHASEAQRRPRRRAIQVISQDPLSSFDPQYTVERLLAQPLRVHRSLDRTARRAESVRLLATVGLDAAVLARRPSTLSGGQRQRVAIAQALAARPMLLICDEPVSALDVSTQAQVLDLLSELQERFGLALLFISHDLGVVQHMSHRILVMKDGEVVEQGDAERVFTAPEHPYTRALLDAVPRLRPARP